MKRPSPRFEAWGLAAALVLGGSCSTNNSVKPGAPVLTEVIFVDNGSAYAIMPTSPTCDPTVVSEGAKCDSSKDRGPCLQVPNVDAGVTVQNWCRCQGVSACTEFGSSPTASTWTCAPFSPTTPLIAVFDRLLDTAPFEQGDASGPLTNVATVQTVPPAIPLTAMDAIYTPNGSPEFDDAGHIKTLLFPIYQHCVYGTFNGNGPNLAMVPDPQLPTGQAVSIQLLGTSVRAKDGRTPFSGTGMLMDGIVTFQTIPFSASIKVPKAPPTDAAAPTADGGADGGAPSATVPADNAPAEIDFTAPVDLTKVVVDIKVVANGVEMPIITMLPDGGVPPSTILAASPTPTSITLTPTSTWPPNSTISVQITAAATDLLDEPLVAAQMSPTFTTGS
jgi:hypothetical protein